MSTTKLKESYVVYQLGKEMYALNVHNVLEVLQDPEINLVPEAPANILGVVNFRGNIVPIIDLHQKFKISKTSTDIETFIILETIIDETEVITGIRVDKVIGVSRINLQDIKNPPELGNTIKTKYLKGVYKSPDGFIFIIDAVHLFVPGEITSSEDIIAEINDND